MKRWGFLAAYALPVMLVAGYLAGNDLAFYAVPVFIFGVLPLVDLVAGRDQTNPDPNDFKAIQSQKFFRWITWAYVPLHWALIVWGAYVVSQEPLTTAGLIGFLLSLGIITGGVGITFAHELGHRPNRLEQWLAQVTLVGVCYGHFFIEHNKGHHAHVATPDDPASARLGESFYAFFPRTLGGSWLNAWRIETKRLTRKGVPLWSHHNAMLWYVFLPLLFAALLGFVWGWLAVICFFAQSFIAFSLLELVNYVEHYGLQRQSTGGGKYEKVTHLHSWNASETVTNYFLINLQRHSDHHAYPNRRFQTLRHHVDSPQLPTGYAGMILLALCPPIFRAVMDPRAKAMRPQLT